MPRRAERDRRKPARPPRGRPGPVVALLAVLLAGLHPVSRLEAQEPPAPPETRTGDQAADPLLIALEGRLARGFTLSTALELSRRLSLDPGETTPQLVLLAARAYAEARAWVSVRRLLLERDWLDRVQDGEGRVLLARAYLGLGDADRAVEEFRRSRIDALPTARRVEYAEALRESGRLEEAARTYLEAAAEDPELAGWLRLTAVQTWAAAGQPDSASAAAVGLEAHTAPWRDSAYAELAGAWLAGGDTARALAIADSMTRRARSGIAHAWLVPTLAARGDTSRALREAESALRYGGVGPGVGAFLTSVDSSVARLRRVARVETREGRPDDAAELLRLALDRAESDERAELTLELAEALFSSRDYGAVRQTLDPWIGDDEPSGSAGGARVELEQRMRFLAGRALYRSGLRSAASELWREVAADPAAPDGAYAAFLLADIAHDRGEVDEARSRYGEAVSRFPRSSWAGSSLIRLGMLDLVEDRPDAAVEHFDTYRRRFPGGNWYTAANYWAARSRDLAGDSAQARVLYRQVLGDDPIGYYGIESARALGEEAWDHLELRATPPVRLRPDHAALVRRMSRLRDMGWKGRALRELFAREGPRESREDRLALAIALNEAGFTWQGTSVAWGVYRARSGRWSEDLLRAVYPLIYEPVLRERALAERLDPTLVAALVRRESQFDRDVVSRAGAVGLMQIMPATGAEVARRAGIGEYRSSQLVVPEVNIVLGSRYLRELLERRNGALVPALISYNAGPHRFVSWRSFPEFSASTELMIDRIPFSETRRYVKAILSYRYIYRKLYEEGPGEVDSTLTGR